MAAALGEKSLACAHFFDCKFDRKLDSKLDRFDKSVCGRVSWIRMLGRIDLSARFTGRPVAQLAERRSPKPKVGGSIPSWPASVKLRRSNGKTSCADRQANSCDKVL